MDTALWDQLARGIDCPLDAPRADSSEHWDIIAPLATSSLYLAKNQTYRGQCILIFDSRHVSRPDQLSATEWTAFCTDLYRSEVAIASVVKPDHINIETLGNVVPHLHWHIVPRYRTDPRWGSPIWTTNLSEMPDQRLSVVEQHSLVEEIGNALAA